MAINDDTQNQNNIGADNARPATQERVRGRDNMFSFHGVGMFSSPISRGVGSEHYSKLKTGLTEIFKEASGETEISLIDLDNQNEPALAFSSIIIALRLKNAPEVGVAYYIMTLEATGDKLSPIYENVSSNNIEVLRVTSDAVDDVLLSKAHARVQKHFPNAGNWYYVDGVVVPADFNPDNKYGLHQLALNAGLAAVTELQIRQKGFQDLNMAHMSNDSTLNVNINFSRQQLADTVGHPMRSDIMVNFVSKKNNQDSRRASVNSGGNEAKISELSGFVDLIWDPVSQMNVYNPWSQNVQGQTQKYVARLILTHLANNYACTPAAVLLALATSLTVRDENNWIQAFRPAPVRGSEIDITDIGAVNIEANLTNDPSGFGIPIDTKSDTFKLEDLGQLVGALIKPGLVISLDCPEVGPQSWYLSMFAAAANGVNGAYNSIYNAANQLTNGNFGKYFPQGAPMFVDTQNRVHLGYWTDRTGQKRDIRDIDHIAVCNLAGRTNPQIIRDWSDTFLRTQYPLIQRLHARKKMISSLTNETAVFTGFAQRVTFSAGFLDALAKGVRETGMAVRIMTPLSASDFNNQRGVGNWASGALLSPGQTFMQAGGFGQPQYASYGQYTNLRW